ncbi:MAG: hypothetical protein H7281_13580 [Bacteriovorax sp.]|nr:hypothetical protein [Bacteriovorax sp.]
MRFSFEYGVTMFRSGLTKAIYKSFLSSYQLNRSELEITPFIYVDLDSGQVKFLTSLMSTKEVGSEIYAVSIASGGNVEVLSTENH